MMARSNAMRIHTFHGHLLHGYFAGWKIKLVIAIEKFLARHTDQLIAVGNQVKDDLLAVGIGTPEKFKTFFPGLPAPVAPSRTVARQELSLDENQIYCSFVGRLTQIKRPDRLLDVVKACVDRGLNIDFIVAGEGELFASSQERALAENLPITFLGWRSDIARIFAASDIAILTSDNEGIPLTLIQAAQAGLPIVATRVGSITDIVIDGQTGYLTSPQPGAMASALSALAGDLKLREVLGASGKVHADTFFSLSKSLADHSALYEFSQHQ
jgi:glycosyltransferase involved in cell wall biosynthesis